MGFGPEYNICRGSRYGRIQVFFLSLFNIARWSICIYLFIFLDFSENDAWISMRKMYLPVEPVMRTFCLNSNVRSSLNSVLKLVSLISKLLIFGCTTEE